MVLKEACQADDRAEKGKVAGRRLQGRVPKWNSRPAVEILSRSPEYCGEQEVKRAQTDCYKVYKVSWGAVH